MAIEIELKFIIAPSETAVLTHWLHRQTGQYSPSVRLSNTYYETEAGYLRSHDLGLRIRSCDGSYEMTLKGGGKQQGGLHQRVEINIPLNQPQLVLERFPPEIWPTGCQLAQLQQALKPLFSTDFTRERWRVTYQHSTIELALDQGSIRAGEKEEPLCELELELINGNCAELLAFAHQLEALNGLRLSNRSKAARGYALAAGSRQAVVQPFSPPEISPQATLQQRVNSMLSALLNHWDEQTDLWLAGQQQAQQEIQIAVNLLISTIQRVDDLAAPTVNDRALHALRHLQQLLAQGRVSAQDLCYSGNYLAAQLTAIEWLESVDKP